MNYLLDTNILIAYLRSNDLAQRLEFNLVIMGLQETISQIKIVV